MRRRLREQRARLFVIGDTPQSIALGAAIGFLLASRRCARLKTLLAFLLAALL